jgi:hypothetical protein
LETKEFQTSFELISQISKILNENSTLQNLKIFKEIKLETELKKEKLKSFTLKSVQYNFKEDFIFELKSNLKFETFWKIISQDEFILKHHLGLISKNLKEKIFDPIFDSENVQIEVDGNSFQLKFKDNFISTSLKNFHSLQEIILIRSSPLFNFLMEKY